jgi:uncharacterized membrane protein HdeD (DUF308 family)
MTEQFDRFSRRASTGSILWAILIICLGLLAIALPVVPSIGIALGLGFLMIAVGVIHLVNTFDSRGVGHTLWRLLISIAYLLAGTYLVAHPIVGVAGITLALAGFFFAKGIVDVAAYFSGRKAVASGWMLVDGLVTLVLGLMIWRRWPISSLSVVGTLVGVGMVFSGTSRLMMALSFREFLSGHGDNPVHNRRAA